MPVAFYEDRNKHTQPLRAIRLTKLFAMAEIDTVKLQAVSVPTSTLLAATCGGNQKSVYLIPPSMAIDLAVEQAARAFLYLHSSWPEKIWVSLARLYQFLSQDSPSTRIFRPLIQLDTQLPDSRIVCSRGGVGG